MELTNDTLFDGELSCKQHRQGYRFSIDSVILAHFCLSWKKARVLDLGCGCGVLGLILLYRIPTHIQCIDGIDYQRGLIDLAKQNAIENNFGENYHLKYGDYINIGQYYQAESFSHVICNPPFYRKGSGRTSQNEEAFLARHQAKTSTADVVNTIAFVLQNRGTASLVFPADSAADLLVRLGSRNLTVKRLRPVYSYPEAAKASLILVECIKNGGTGLSIEQPLFVFSQKNGEYSAEMNRMYQPNTVWQKGST